MHALRPIPSSNPAIPAFAPLPGQLILGTREAVQHFDTNMVPVNDYGHTLEELGFDITACFQNPAAELVDIHQQLVQLTIARVGVQWLPYVQRAALPLANVILTHLRVLSISMPEAWSTGQFTYFFGRWHQYDLVLHLANLK
jgi:hypothetical protein